MSNLDWGDDDDDALLCTVNWDVEEQRLLESRRCRSQGQATTAARHVLHPLQTGSLCQYDSCQEARVPVVCGGRNCGDEPQRVGQEWWQQCAGGERKRAKKARDFPVPATLEHAYDVTLTMVPAVDGCSFVLAAGPFSKDSSLRTVFSTCGSWDSEKNGWLLPFSEYDQLMKCAAKQGLSVQPLHVVAKSVMKQVGLSKDDTMRYGYIPTSLEEKLMEFQREGVKFVLRHGGRALLGDEMGLGKTVQALAVLSAYKDEWPVLIVCPSSLRESWSSSIQEWLGVPENKIRVIHSGKDAEQTRIGSFEFLVISYNFLDKMKLEGKFNLVIVDESHYLKDPSAKRTKAAMPILRESKRCLLLTGTPALNRPKEIFTQLACLVPRANLKMKDFGERYCSGNRFDKYGGAKNLEELYSLLRSSIMIRRLKADVLAELPRKRRQQVFLGLDGPSKKKLDALQQQLQESRAAIHHLVAQSAAAKKNHVHVSAEQKSVIMEVYKKTADLKVKFIQEYVDTLLHGGEKFLIFAHHTCLLDAIEHSCNRKKDCKYIRIDGNTPSHSRANLVDSFQNDDSVRVAILSIRAAGVGLTLTAASTVVFAEMTWTPGEIIQAEDRAHRIGQAASVNVYFLHIKNSIDDVIWNSIQSKLENLGQTLDGIDQNLSVSQTRTLPEKGQTQILSFLSQSQKNPTD